MNAYLRSPALHGDTIVFATDDDLWSCNKFGGIARRLTTSKGTINAPRIDPTGTYISYVGNEHGQSDLYIIPIEGGSPRRLTYHGVMAHYGWTSKNEIQYQANYQSFHPRAAELYTVNINTLVSKKLKLGPANCHMKDKSFELLGRNIGDPARWKRYRGGTAGTLWTKTTAKGKYSQILKNIKGNLANPRIHDGEIYFISDHQGIGNIYKCNKHGKSVKRVTHEGEYYVRSFSIHGDQICYVAGAEVFIQDIKSKTSQKVEIQAHGTFNQAQDRFSDCEDYLQDFNLSQKSDYISLISRGKLFSIAPYAGGALQFGDNEKRYRMARYVSIKGSKKSTPDENERILAVELDRENEERLILIDEQTSKTKELAIGTNWGKIYEMVVSHDGSKVAIANNRKDFFLYDVHKDEVSKITTGKFDWIKDISWSPDDLYIAFQRDDSYTKRSIHLYDIKKKKVTGLTTPLLHDFSPSWDPDGNYLYFLSVREFRPVYNETHFDLGFPFATSAYAVVLNKDAPSPLDICHEIESDDEDSTESEQEDSAESKKTKSSKKSKDKKKQPEVELIVEIDFDGLNDRIIALPVEHGGIHQIIAGKDKFFYLQSKVSGLNPHGHWMEGADAPTLYSYNLKEMKKEVWQKGVHEVDQGRDDKTLLVYCDDGLRMITKEAKPTEGDSFMKKDGWINLERVKVPLSPKKEWKQMYQEAWILQREHFWTKDMSRINWQTIYKRYLPMLEKVHTRTEFSDLIWEMQGELGTSHCYEMMGDYNKKPLPHSSGFLGGEYKFLGAGKGFQITKITSGDSWINNCNSPLTAPGVALNTGDVILRVNGVELNEANSLERQLENRSSDEVCLSVLRKGKKEVEHLDIKTISTTAYLNYREWVDKNRAYVHKASKGKVGYVHVPNMAAWGYSEFYRQFITESEKDGLIIDVRYNGGGHVSQHLLKILKQKVIGFDQTRYFGVEKYPGAAINGPIVCVTNEHAGSDGDIFSHSFKLMGIGKLIGKRTWGGVIGIWPRLGLNDGSFTTQPEFSHWFKDVGYDVENYGTDPDIEVDILPSDYAKGIDTQLDRSIKEALKDIKKNHLPMTKLKEKPNLALPKLPKS